VAGVWCAAEDVSVSLFACESAMKIDMVWEDWLFIFMAVWQLSIVVFIIVGLTQCGQPVCK
jgi:hypothetical protein